MLYFFIKGQETGIDLRITDDLLISNVKAAIKAVANQNKEV